MSAKQMLKKYLELVGLKDFAKQKPDELSGRHQAVEPLLQGCLSTSRR